MLQEQDRKKLDNIVQQMTANGEKEQDIQFVVNDFKQKYDKPQKQGFDFRADLLGMQDPNQQAGFFGETFRNTLGSRGLAGVAQTPGRVLGSFVMGKAGAQANEMVQRAHAQLADITDKLAQKLKDIPQDDPRRAMLVQTLKENFQKLGMAQDAQKDILGKAEAAQITPGEIFGTAINAGLTVAGGGLKGATQTLRIPGLAAIKFPTPAILQRTPVLGAKSFFRAVAKRAVQTGTVFGGFTTADGLINDKAIDEVAKDAAVSFGLGALGSGLFSAFATGPLQLITNNKATARIFRSGLGMGKAVQKAEERNNKLAAELLIKHGAGTADQLKQKYSQLAEQSEAKIQEALSGYMRSTGKGGTFESQQILREIEKAYKEQFRYSLSRGEIQKFMETLPLDVLTRKDRINVFELNQLRREITNKMISPTAFTRDTVTEGATRALMTVGDVLSNKVKSTVRATIPIFESYRAYVQGIDALLNRVAATQGPVATGARVVGGAVGGAIGGAVGGAIGGVLGGIPGFALGVGAEEFARSTLGRTGVAVLLRKLGINVQKLSQSEVGQLVNLLQKAGISSLSNQ